MLSERLRKKRRGPAATPKRALEDDLTSADSGHRGEKHHPRHMRRRLAGTLVTGLVVLAVVASLAVFDVWPRVGAAILSRTGISETATTVVLDGCEAAYPEHPSQKSFRLSFSDISIHVLMEILDLSEAQESRLIDAYDACKVAMEKARVYPVGDQEQQQAMVGCAHRRQG